MSSPFSHETQRGTEETIEAISRARTWLKRIDTTNDAPSLNVSEFCDKLAETQSELEHEYTLKTIEREVNNFVFNNVETVEEMLHGNLSEKVEAINELETYVTGEFGYVTPPNLTEDEWLWLVAQEVKRQQESPHGIDTSGFEEATLSTAGNQPEKWSDGYPQHESDTHR